MSTNDQQAIISSFLEVAVGQSAETARQFLQVGPPFSLRCCLLQVSRFSPCPARVHSLQGQFELELVAVQKKNKIKSLWLTGVGGAC